MDPDTFTFSSFKWPRCTFRYMLSMLCLSFLCIAHTTSTSRREVNKILFSGSFDFFLLHPFFFFLWFLSTFILHRGLLKISLSKRWLFFLEFTQTWTDKQFKLHLEMENCLHFLHGGWMLLYDFWSQMDFKGLCKFLGLCKFMVCVWVWKLSSTGWYLKCEIRRQPYACNLW